MVTVGLFTPKHILKSGLTSEIFKPLSAHLKMIFIRRIDEKDDHANMTNFLCDLHSNIWFLGLNSAPLLTLQLIKREYIYLGIKTVKRVERHLNICTRRNTFHLYFRHVCLLMVLLHSI